MKGIPEKAMTKVARRICRKHRVLPLTVSRATLGGKMMVGNFILMPPPSPKMVRRLRNALPEMKKKLERTAICCEWRGGLDFQDLELFMAGK